MARRIVNGSSYSENGWPLVDQGSCRWIRVPGAEHVSLQIQQGPPSILLGAWAADWHAYIEPLRDADSACWTATNDVLGVFGKNNGSNHLGGTAIDLNWGSHPFRKRGSLNAAQMQVMAEMEAFYEGTVFWAGRWDNPADEMHSQCGYNTYDRAADRPKQFVLDFINRKIRPDGFSTFRRGGSTAPAPAADAAQILARATGLTEARAREVLPQVRDGLAQSECVNAKRIAMWLAQIGHESGSFKYTEEIQSGDESTDRWLYKGRTWIQITWKANYLGFSGWAFQKGICPSPTYFVDHPRELAQQKYAGVGAAWYWTVARKDINRFSDAQNITEVTRLINGGQNGIDDRRARYSRALAVGDELLQLLNTAEEDDMAAATEGPSLSIYRLNDDPIGLGTPVERQTNAMVHEHRVEQLALIGVPWEQNLVKRIADGDPSMPAIKAGQPGIRERAQAILAMAKTSRVTAADA